MLLAPRPGVGGRATIPFRAGREVGVGGVGVAGGVALTSVGRGQLGGGPRPTLSPGAQSKGNSRIAAPLGAAAAGLLDSPDPLKIRYSRSTLEAPWRTASATQQGISR